MGITVVAAVLILWAALTHLIESQSEWTSFEMAAEENYVRDRKAADDENDLRDFVEACEEDNDRARAEAHIEDGMRSSSR